jgi:hypothetical protein
VRYTGILYKKGSPMNFMLFLLCWYAVALGIFLLQRGLNHWRSQVRARPQESLMILKEGETIIGVADWPDTMRFYIRTNIVDEKRYE